MGGRRLHRAILLCLSSGDCGALVLEESPDVSCDVALEAASDFAVGLALGSASRDVGLGGFVMVHAHESDHVASPVEFPVAVSVEAMPILALPRVRRQRSDTGQSGVCRFGAAAARVCADGAIPVGSPT